MRVVLTDAAIDDLAAIRAYLEGRNPTAYRVIAEHIKQALLLLEEFPSMGRAGQHLGTRELVVRSTNYVLVYEGSSDTLTVLRVWDGRQGGRPITDA